MSPNCLEIQQEQISYLTGTFTYVGASLVAQMVKNLPAMQETQVQSLGRCPGERNDHLLQCACLENSTDRGAWRATVHGNTFRCDWVTDTIPDPHDNTEKMGDTLRTSESLAPRPATSAPPGSILKTRNSGPRPTTQTLPFNRIPGDLSVRWHRETLLWYLELRDYVLFIFVFPMAVALGIAHIQEMLVEEIINDRWIDSQTDRQMPGQLCK